MPEDLEVLARGVEDLGHVRIRHQIEKGREVEALSERVDGNASSSEASWMTQTFGQNVVSRRNSVSTVTKGWAARRRQTEASSSVEVMRLMGG